MKKRMMSLLMILMILAQVLPAFGAETAVLLPVTFFNMESTDILHYEVEYREDVFSGDPGVYNHDLARMSLGMALSAFHSYEEGKTPFGNIDLFLRTAGFSDLRDAGYDELNSSDSIGSMIGSKKLGDRTLVAVALRGGGYQMEWVGNMDVGSPEDEQMLRHAGFQRAMETVLGRVREYTASLDGPVTFWIAGYSRSAAVSNLLAAELLNTGLADQQHLYAYTFATPAPSRMGNETDERYRGIWNIVKAFDPVPRVPLQEWGFTRYGHTRYLTCSEADADFEELRAKAWEWDYEHFGGEWFADSYVNYVLRVLLQTLYTMVPDAETYVREFQTAMQNTFRESDDPLAAMDELFRLYNAQAENPSMGSLADFMTEQAWQGLLQWAGSGHIDMDSRRDLISNLAWEHFPEAYVCLLMSSGEELYDFPLTYWHICVFDKTKAEVYGWSNTDADRSFYTEMDAGGTDGTWPCVVLSGGAIIALPSEMDYALLFDGPAGTESSVIIRRYTLGSLETENFVSDPLKMREGITTWAMLSGDQVEISYGKGTDVVSDTMTRETSVEESTARDLEILSRGSGVSLAALAVILGALILGLVITVTMAVRAYIRGKRKKTSVMLLVLVGVLFTFTMLCDFFLPAHAGLRMVFTGLTTGVCLLECVLCSMAKGSRRNYFMLSGFLLFLASDLVYDMNQNGGMILSLAGNLLFCAAFRNGKRPGWKDVVCWAVLGAALCLGIQVLREPFGEEFWILMIYGLSLSAMVTQAWKQGGLIRIGSLLYLLSDAALLMIYTGWDYWWTWLVCRGRYYAAVCVMAVGAKGDQPLQPDGTQAETDYTPPMGRAGFLISAFFSLLFLIGELYVANNMRGGQLREILLAVFTGLLGLTVFQLCLAPAWRIWKSWMFCGAGGVLTAAVGNVLLRNAVFPALISLGGSLLFFAVSFSMLRKPDKKERILFMALWGAAGIGVVLSGTWTDNLPLQKGWMIFFAGLVLMLLLLSLRQSGWLRTGGILFAAAVAGLLAARMLQMETGAVCGIVQGSFYAALLCLTGGFRRLVRTEETGAGEPGSSGETKEADA